MLFDLCEICDKEGIILLIMYRGFRKEGNVRARTCEQHRDEVKLMLSKQLSLMS